MTHKTFSGENQIYACDVSNLIGKKRGWFLAFNDMDIKKYEDIIWTDSFCQQFSRADLEGGAPGARPP